MSRRTLPLAAMALALALTGCAVGRFIVGAPADGRSDPRNALLARRCGGCHEIPDPAKMPAAEWRDALTRMHRRMSLPAAEWDSLAAMARRD